MFLNTAESPRLLSSWFRGITQTVIHPQLVALKGFPRSVLVHLICDGSLCASLSLRGLCVSALPVLRGSRKGDLTECSYAAALVLHWTDVKIS